MNFDSPFSHYYGFSIRFRTDGQNYRSPATLHDQMKAFKYLNNQCLKHPISGSSKMNEEQRMKHIAEFYRRQVLNNEYLRAFKQRRTLEFLYTIADFERYVFRNCNSISNQIWIKAIPKSQTNVPSVMEEYWKNNRQSEYNRDNDSITGENIYKNEYDRS